MRKALDKAKSNEVTINFDDYQKDYRGGKWILQKDGKVDVEATNAYNEAVLNGTLPKKANAATQEAELLKGILASLKNKKDPITGADISSVQVLSILSGLAFSYRAGRYRGKKLTIPNPDKRKRKEKKKKKETNGTDFEDIIKKGEKMPDHEVVEKGSLPKAGKPNSSADILNADGSVKQRRYYDEKGRAKEDIDFNHSDDGTHEFPHRHKWDWTNPEKPKRLK
nr:hypothetical protein [Listeria immobilis]